MKAFDFSIKSFFFKLLGGFLIIIVFLLVVNIVVNSYLQTKMHKETIKYNETEINEVVQEYEEFWERLTYRLKLDFYRDEDVLDLYYDKEFNYTASWDISNKLRANITTNEYEYVNSLLTNEYEYIHNLVIVMQSPPNVIHMNGSTGIESMFTEWIVSEYSHTFWQSQFDKQYRESFFSAVDFQENMRSFNELKKIKLMPIVIKNKYYPEMYLLLLIDIVATTEAFRHPLSNNFYMMAPNSTMLYSIDGKKPVIDYNQGGEGIEQIDDDYYFYKQGKFSGITYINKVEASLITSEKEKLNVLVWSSVLLALVMGIIISWILSVKLYSPVKRTMKLFQDFKRSSTTMDNKGEFNVIDNHIKSLIHQKESISEDLENKSSLLKSFAYSVRLKDFYTNSELFNNVSDEEKPYYQLILFDISFLKSFQDELNLEEKKGVYYYSELIDQYMSKWFEATATFQIENREIISMVFLDKPDLQMKENMNGIVEILNRDLEYCYFTIVIGKVYDSKTIMTEAYENIRGSISHRKLGKDHQVLSEGGDVDSFQLSRKQEGELETYMEAKNFDLIRDWIRKTYTQMEKKNAPKVAFANITIAINDRVADHISKKYEADMGKLNSKDLKHYDLLEEFLELIHKQLDLAESLMKQPDEAEKDHIVAFIIDYLEKHFTEDVSLEKIAQTRNMTSNYLSVYFKAKTGENFSDYLNELRINAAKEMLFEPGMTIQAIGEKVGYPSINSFYRMFKKQTGYTPGEYRKKHMR